MWLTLLCLLLGGFRRASLFGLLLLDIFAVLAILPNEIFYCSTFAEDEEMIDGLIEELTVVRDDE